MKKNTLLVSFILIILFTGCVQNVTPKDPQVPQNVDTTLVTTTVDVMEITLDIQPSATQNQESLTPELNETPTNTYLPVYDNVSEQLEYLNTVPCDLPCYWGISPGISDRESVLRILTSLKPFLSDDEYFEFDEFISFVVKDSERNITYSVEFLFHNNEVVELIKTKIFGIEELPKHDTLKDENIQYQEAIEQYLISNLYKKYGVPDDVYIRSYYPSPEVWPTQTLIHYRTNGLLIAYLNPTYFIQQEEKNKICLVDNPTIVMWLSSPHQNATVSQLLGSYGASSDNLYSIDEIIGMNTEEFFALYIDENGKFDCKNRYFEIPIDDYWTSFYIQF